MSDDQDGCEWVSVFSGTGLPGLSRTKAVKRLCVCVCVCVLGLSIVCVTLSGPRTANVSNELLLQIDCTNEHKMK